MKNITKTLKLIKFGLLTFFSRNSYEDVGKMKILDSICLYLLATVPLFCFDNNKITKL
jgi:hypothetical protein